MTDATELDEAAIRRDAQVVRDHIPRGYHVAHRVADGALAALDEITRLRAALDEARAEVERLNDKVTEYADLVPRALRGRLDEHADDCPICDHAAWAQLDELCSEEMDRAEAAESALAAVRALADEWRAAGFEIEPDQLTALLASSAPATASETVEVVRGWRVYADGSRSPIERWVRAADGDWISLDSTRRTSGDILIDFEEHRDA